MNTLLNTIYNTKHIPDSSNLSDLIDKALILLDGENEKIRPSADDDSPGGIIHLYHDIPTIIIPDIHARMELILSLNNLCTEEKSFFELMENKEIQVVCVGDGFHSELLGKERWQGAFTEYQKDFKKHKNMDEEMMACFGLMEMIMHLKLTYPDNFHFLKGNHENIKNEETGGDHPFRKFVLEGEMVKRWVLKFMGETFLDLYSEFEKKLPLLAIGENFLISHAEPRRLFSPEEIVNHYDETIHGLTWTANGEAEENSVREMLDLYLPDKEIDEKLYFAGHRTISKKYKLRANGLLVQIHNPLSLQIVYVKPLCTIDLDNDIIDISGSK